MNTQLVNSLVQIIQSLSSEEQQLLQQKLSQTSNSTQILDIIDEHRKAIHTRRQNQPFNPGIDEIFTQMREERSQELQNSLMSNSEKA
ncbi:MAG: hypothetical protein SAJ12_11150 [Jaaginema sp. PMC 1079.18]|nr:hypothetical protein [Jaaginema sp. PMC 1080.18]MEC4851559.1 hypothetical protein [Jaaginema sp. PMC 1079.18]MEC4869005.1 hypothetical protein [Jaaginema sp. PMC 1078.18]